MKTLDHTFLRLLTVFLALTTSTLMAAPPTTHGTETDAGKTPKSGWAFDSQVEGWGKANDISGFEWQDGGYVGGTFTGFDPYVYSPDYLKMDLATLKRVTLRLKNNSAGTKARIYFMTDNAPSWDQAKSQDFTITANSDFTTYTVDMSVNSDWTGTLRQIRLDPVDDGTRKGSFSLDWFYLVP